MAHTILRRKMLRASDAAASRRPKVNCSAAFERNVSYIPVRDAKPLEQRLRCTRCAMSRCRALTPVTQLRTFSPHRRRLLIPMVKTGSAATATATATANATTAGMDGALTVSVKLVVPFHATSHGQQLVLVGSCEALGDWDPSKGVTFNWCEGHSHSVEVELPIHTTIACKLVVLGQNNQATWEPEANRELILAPSSLASRAAGYTVLCHWGFPECTQVLANSLRRGGSGGDKGGGHKANGHVNNTSVSSLPTTMGTAMGDNPIIAGVKKALQKAHASSRAGLVLPGMTSSWEEEAVVGLVEEEEAVPCQVTVLVPRTGPKLKTEQSLVLVGSSPALGRWDTAQGLLLERVGEDSPMWVAQTELALGDNLQAKVVAVDSVTGTAQIWEPCENRTVTLNRSRSSSRPVMVTAYWGIAPTHCLEVDRLSSTAAATNPQVVQLLRQQLAATSSQLDGLRRERDDARKAIAANEEQVRHLEGEVKSLSHVGHSGREEMVQLAEQLQATRRLYEMTKKEARELGGTVGVTRQLCDVAKREMAGLAAQMDAAKRAYEVLVPQVERMERQLANTNKAFEATKPELQALETQLERARGMFDRTLQKIEAAKALTAAASESDLAAVRRRSIGSTSHVAMREIQFAKF